MNIKTFILFYFVLLGALNAYANSDTQENSELKAYMAKTDYNSNPAILNKIKKMDNAIGLIACVGCHNNRATYTIITKEDGVFKFKYHDAMLADLKDAKKEFTIEEKDALEIIETMSAEIDKAKGAAPKKTGKKQTSSFEFGVKVGDEWKFAGQYSPDSSAVVNEISTIIKLFDESQMPRKMYYIREAKANQ